MLPRQMQPGANSAPLKIDADELLEGAHLDADFEQLQLQPPFNLPPQGEEPAYRDPLGDYCDQHSFNIIQFLAENDTPSVSPADASMRAAANNGAGASGLNNNHGGHHGGQDNMQAAAHAQQQRLYAAAAAAAASGNGQPPGRLPDSPPITDVSAAGSSGSPSSNSDSPYSPENYAAYSVHQHQQQQAAAAAAAAAAANNNGLILGVADLGGMIDQLPPGVLAGRGPQQHAQQAQHSLYMNQYGNGHTQISPPAAAATLRSVLQAQQEQQHHAQYGAVGNYGGIDVFGDLINAAATQPDGLLGADPVSRKRQRIEPLAQAPSQLPYVTSVRARGAASDARAYGSAANGAVSMAASPVGGESCMDENFHQGGEVIKFTKFQEETWYRLFDENQRELHQMQVHVVADKGFNYSHVDQCFVNQKKNHFQISVNIEANDEWPPRYVHVNNQLLPIEEMKLAFCGVKHEMPTSEIQIRQSQTDRKPVPHDPVTLNLIPARQLTKVTVPRLHFSETTLNNQRKNSRPNPDQKYFLLVVRLLACTPDGGAHLVQAYASEKVIVRATNPGQFEPPDADVAWMKNGSTMFCNGPVSIGADRAVNHAVLNVHGDIYHAGQFLNPSDRRLKENIVEVPTDDAMDRLGKFRIVEYAYKPEIAAQWGLTEQARHRVGVIAQELAEIMPDAVKQDGEFLTIDESRMFYDNIVATQELCRLHGDLEDKIDGRVEAIQKTLSRIFRRKTDPPEASPSSTDTPNPAATTSASHASGLSEDSGLAQTKPYLSQSRYSLASTFKKELERVHSKGGYCEHPSCHRNGNQPICSSRLTQGTIVTLVIVMAVCLLSMSTLYVLDWHQRNYGVHPIMPPTPLPPTQSSTDGVGLMTQLNVMPSRQPLAPPIHAVCTHRFCQTYCCPDRVFFESDPILQQSSLVDLAGASPSARKQFLAAAAGAPELSPAAFSPKPLSSGVSITVLGLNMTLDERYCEERKCSKRRGRFSLYIPVSPYLPTAPIQLRFDVPKGRLINSCGYLADFHTEQCSFRHDPFKAEHSKVPTAYQVNENVFEISAALYMKSAYRFRIGYTSESCYSSEEHLSGAFEQYDLFFYRTCPMPLHTLMDAALPVKAA